MRLDPLRQALEAYESSRSGAAEEPLRTYAVALSDVLRAEGVAGDAAALRAWLRTAELSQKKLFHRALASAFRPLVEGADVSDACLLQLLGLSREFLAAAHALEKPPLSAVKVILSKILPTADLEVFARCQRVVIEYLADYAGEKLSEVFSLCCFLSDGLDARELRDAAGEAGGPSSSREVGALPVDIIAGACVCAWLAGGAERDAAGGPEALLAPVLDTGTEALAGWLSHRFPLKEIEARVAERARDLASEAGLWRGRREGPSAEFVSTFVYAAAGSSRYTLASLPGVFLTLLTENHDAASLKGLHARLGSAAGRDAPLWVACHLCLIEALILCAMAQGAGCLASDPSRLLPRGSGADGDGATAALEAYASNQMRLPAARAISAQFARIYERLRGPGFCADADGRELVSLTAEVLDSIAAAQFLCTIVASQSQTLAVNGTLAKCLAPATVCGDALQSGVQGGPGGDSMRVSAGVLRRILGLRPLQIRPFVSTLRAMYRACGRHLAAAKTPACGAVKAAVTSIQQFLLAELSYSRTRGEAALAVLEGRPMDLLYGTQESGCTQLCQAFRGRTGVCFPPLCFDWAEARAVSLEAHLALFAKDYLYLQHCLERFRSLSKRLQARGGPGNGRGGPDAELLCVLATSRVAVAISQPQHAWYALQSGTKALEAYSTGEARGKELEDAAADLQLACASLDVLSVPGMRALSLALLLLAENLACSRGSLYAGLAAERAREERIWLLSRVLGSSAGARGGPGPWPTELEVRLRESAAGASSGEPAHRVHLAHQEHQALTALSEHASQLADLSRQLRGGAGPTGPRPGVSTAAAAAVVTNLAQGLLKASRLSSNLALFRRVKLIEMSLLPSAPGKLETFLRYEKERDVRWLVEHLVGQPGRPGDLGHPRQANQAGEADQARQAGAFAEFPRVYAPAPGGAAHPTTRLPRNTLLEFLARRAEGALARPKQLCVFPPRGGDGGGGEAVPYHTVSLSLGCDIFPDDIVNRFLLGVFDVDEPPFSEEEAEEFLQAARVYYRGKELYLEVEHIAPRASDGSISGSSAKLCPGPLVFSLPMRNKGQDRGALHRALHRLSELDDDMRAAVGVQRTGRGGTRFSQAVEALLEADCILPAAFLAANRAMRCLHDFGELSRAGAGSSGSAGGPSTDGQEVGRDNPALGPLRNQQTSGPSDKDLAVLLAAADKCLEVVCDTLLPAALDPLQGIFSQFVCGEAEGQAEEILAEILKLSALISPDSGAPSAKEASQLLGMWSIALLSPRERSLLGALKLLAAVLGHGGCYSAVVEASRDAESGPRGEQTMVSAFLGRASRPQERQAVGELLHALLPRLRGAHAGPRAAVELGLDAALFRLPFESSPDLDGLDVTRRADYGQGATGAVETAEEGVGDPEDLGALGARWHPGGRAAEIVEDPTVQGAPGAGQPVAFAETADPAGPHDAYLVDPGGTLPGAREEFGKLFSALPGRWIGAIGAGGEIAPKELLRGVSGVRRGARVGEAAALPAGTQGEGEPPPQSRVSGGETAFAGPAGNFPVYFYAGHNAGESSLPLNFVSSLQSLPLCIVIGCSSMTAVPVGGSLALGACQYYRSAPCLVGCLWDALGGELDRASTLLLRRWTQGGSTISQCLREARASCRLRYLVGSCLVLFGAPGVAYAGAE